MGAGSTTTGGVAAAAGAGSGFAGTLAVTAGVVSTTAGEVVVVLVAVSAAAGALAVGIELAVADAQWSEIIFTAVTATLLSVTPELVAVVFAPVTAMSWPTCGFRSTVLLEILKVCVVPSSARM